MRTRSTRPPWVSEAVTGRPLVAEELDDGTWLVLTRTEAVRVGEDGVRWRRAWHEIARGEWDGEKHTLVVHGVDEDSPVVLTTLAEHPRDLPLTFRERVDASIVHVETASARGGGTLRAAVRRTADGDLLTQVVAVGPVQRGPELEAQVDALEAKVRDAVGL